MSRKDDFTPVYQTGVTGVEHRNIGAAGDDHPFGDEPKEFTANLQSFIRQVADDLYATWEATVREYLANAETACLKVEKYLEDPEASPYHDMIVEDSYEPKIVVVWDRSKQKLTIEDNGIGMAAIEVDEVFRHIGRSAARDYGDMSGSFGMGALSFPKFIGLDNSMIMLSHSRLNDDNAAYLISLAGVEGIMGKLDGEQYGTKFKMDQKEKGMAIRTAVERFSKWMRVPVLYRELDESGEEVFNEDWGDRLLYDDYPVDAPVRTFTIDGAFEAYMSSEAKSRTLLLSMEIDRNFTGSTRAPHNIDIRLLDESGKVVRSSNGNEGLIPTSQREYEAMLIEARPEHITEDLLSNHDVAGWTSTHEDVDYIVAEELLDGETALPVADYVTLSEADEDILGEKEVIIGPNSGRSVVSQEEWDELPQGRAQMYVVESELEEYDLQTDEGDLCLPTPTTDRSQLQSHPTFWKFLGEQFFEDFDRSVQEYAEKLEANRDDPLTVLREMEAQTVADLKDANAR